MPESPAFDPRRLLTEFVAGGGLGQLAAVQAVRQALPQFVDDLTAVNGGDVYERMLTDERVRADFDTLKLAVLADGVRIEPALSIPPEVTDPDPAEKAAADRATEIADFVRRQFEGPRSPVHDAARELLDALAFGNKACEIVLGPGEGEDAGRLVLKRLRGKHRSTLSCVVDPFGELEGFVALRPGEPAMIGAALMGDDPERWSSFVPAWKFVHLVNDPQNGDPRGTSALRAAYLAWFMKTQVLPEYFKFLKQFASPGIIGKTPADSATDMVQDYDESGRPKTDENDVPLLVSAEYALLAALLGWLNAAVLVVKGGTEIEFLQSEGDGQAFLNACAYFDRQITTAILGTTRMTQEAEHGSRADSGTAQDVFGLRVAHHKGRLGICLTRDLVHLLVRVNFGEEGVALCPTAVLSRVEQQDWASELEAVSKAYAAGYIHDSQVRALNVRLGLPPRDEEQVAMEKAERAHLGRMARAEIARVEDPSAGQVERFLAE